MGRVRDGAVRMVDHIDRRSWWVAIALTGLGLAGAWWLALSSASMTAVSRHWFYLPVVFAAVRFGLPGALITGTAGGLLAGAAVFTVDGAATAYGVWVPRAAFLTGVGTFVAALVTVVRDSQHQALHIAGEQKQLAYQRAALIQTVSHEFRTPLTILHGGIQTLEARREEIGERIRPLITSLARAEARLDEMVSVVLATAEALDASQKLEAEPVVLGRLIDDTAATLEQLDGPTRMTTRIDVGAEVVVTVPGYLQVALRCVLDNALKFSPRDREVAVSATRRAEAVTISVQDHGPGIEPEFLDRAFQAFTQADDTARRTHGGLGVGLFTARSMTERLGGSIRIADPSPGGGSTIVIELPQQRAGDRTRRVRRTGSPADRRTHASAERIRRTRSENANPSQAGRTTPGATRAPGRPKATP